MGAQTYSYATFSAGANTAPVDTVLSLINADTGAVSTLTIPSGETDASNLTGGKVALSTQITLAAGQSMLAVCISGGPMTDVELRLHT